MWRLTCAIAARWTTLSRSTVALWAAFQWQAVQTLLLQEGEKILLKSMFTAFKLAYMLFVCLSSCPALIDTQ